MICSRHLRLVHDPFLAICAAFAEIPVRVTVEMPSAPAFRVHDLDAVKRLINVVGEFDASAAGGSVPFDVRDQGFVQIVTLRMCHSKIMAELSGSECKAVWYGHRQ